MYLNEDLFEEVDVSEDYLVEKQGILASLSNRNYKLKGFWGTSLGKRILDAAKAMGLAIKNYEVHHINGLHPPSLKSPDNKAENLALVPINMHRDLTEENDKIVEEVLYNGFGDKVIGGHVMELWIYAKNTGKDISQYIEIQEDLYSDIVNDILTKIVDNFINNHYNTPGHSGIYLVTDLLNQEG